ncbi:MAG: aminoglycoside phosphotransferase family protein [Verrucomicrobia bacterium]|nr:MAG: aminoglycoside phosphotransferase family protein [Verrucomicrobiota bacterium]TAE85841.1 MAG: aminoglycoside phosphotransferase family protein [Verrucomicrobiota bacterium]TAF23368.1 MAG: aminoglycoside phosphotransferase family protein [Verrucomicrobiota bacterium]
MADDSRSPLGPIAARFAFEGDFIDAVEIPSGHINSTFRASFREPSGEVRRYVIQRINDSVFPDPLAVMRNVERVTRHLRTKQEAGARGLVLRPARDGRAWVESDDGGIWRCYDFIEGGVTYDIIENPRQAWQAAHAFGRFQEGLSDLPAEEIEETIADFHHSRKRFEHLMDVVRRDPCGRVAGVAAELDFVQQREADCSVLVDLLERGEIPYRITHNDTKLNNVMIDAATDEALCVIDLDTVMPGSALYDFGDLVRSATSPAAEDEKDLSKVEMRLPMFEALAGGYLAATASFLTDAEVAQLAFSGKLITLETGIRFLSDHLAGDVYFKTRREGHNLDRCRTQFKLVAEIERHFPALEAIVLQSRSRL